MRPSAAPGQGQARRRAPARVLLLRRRVSTALVAWIAVAACLVSIAPAGVQAAQP